ARAVHVTEHGACAFRRNVRIVAAALGRDGHAIRGPVVAGMIETVAECAAIGIRTRHHVVLILHALLAGARNLFAGLIECGGALDVITVTLLVAMKIGHVGSDQLSLRVVPRTIADAPAGVDRWRIAACLLAQIRMPSAVAAPRSLGCVLTNLIGAREAAEIAGA